MEGGLVPAGLIDGEARGRQQRGGAWEGGGGEGRGQIDGRGYVGGAVGDMRGPGIVLGRAVDGPRNMGRRIVVLVLLLLLRLRLLVVLVLLLLLLGRRRRRQRLVLKVL